MFVKTDGYELKYLFPAQLSRFTRYIGKCNICSFNKKKSNYLKADFVISSNLVLASERTKGRKHLVVKSIDFDRFMTSEGTKNVDSSLYIETGTICRANMY